VLAPEGRSVQQLAEVLASLGASSTEQAARQAGVEQIAEGFESEVGVLVHDGVAVASVGFRSDLPVPIEMLEIAAKDGGIVEIPGAGRCSAAVVDVPVDGDCQLVLARSGDAGFSLEEVSLLRSLGRILATALDMLRLRDVVARNEQQLADAQRIARVGSFEWDLVNLTASWSDGLYRILGVEDERPEPEIGLFLSFIHRDDISAVQQRVQLALSGAAAEEIEYRVVRANGDIVWVRARSEVLRDASGQPTLFRGTLLDVNQAKAFEAELAAARDAAMESSRMKSEFLATMSHEIRTPMNGIIGLTGLLLSTDLDERQLQYAEGVESAGESLLAIINDILDFSKIEAGKLDVDECDFDLVQVIEEAVGLVALTAHRKGLELICQPALDLPTDVRGDPAHLRQILLNLTANAAKFTAHGEIIVRASLDAELDSSVIVRFDVIDTGIGIAEGARAGLFEPFSQADPSTTRKYGGTGLGLAICRRLVDAMGGELGVESTMGEGSNFWFTVPLRRQGRHMGALTLAHPEMRVLVADLNTTMRTALCERLHAWGLDCEMAEDGAAALDTMRNAAVRRQPFDLLVTDELLRTQDGVPLVDAVDLDPALSRVRIITLTRDAIGSRVSAPHPRVATSLTKPVRLGQLREVLASPGLTRAAPVRHPTPLANRTDSRGHVLVVEDNATNQLVAVGILRFLGYRADVAANGYEALEAMGRTVYDAVLMDCQMPEMDGYTATGLIRENEGAARHTPIIAMTAGASELDRDRCLAAGMDDYLAKPVKTEHIDAALRKWAMTREQAAVGR
jgi:two-component system, sensor histidine kinase and response regulator